MNADLLRLAGEMIEAYRMTSNGQDPACIKMSPGTLMAFNDGHIVSHLHNVPVILNSALPLGPIFVCDAESLNQPGDIRAE